MEGNDRNPCSRGPLPGAIVPLDFLSPLSLGNTKHTYLLPTTESDPGPVRSAIKEPDTPADDLPRDVGVHRQRPYRQEQHHAQCLPDGMVHPGGEWMPLRTTTHD